MIYDRHKRLFSVTGFLCSWFLCLLSLPAHYIPTFKALGINTVVRLNIKCYPAAHFTKLGILFFFLSGFSFFFLPLIFPSSPLHPHLQSLGHQHCCAPQQQMLPSRAFHQARYQPRRNVLHGWLTTAASYRASVSGISRDRRGLCGALQSRFDYFRSIPQIDTRFASFLFFSSSRMAHHHR